MEPAASNGHAPNSGGATWSATRARTFTECRRKYYYRYHLAPQARSASPTDEAKAAARLKDLIGLEAWMGDLVHRLIETLLNRWKAGVEPTDAEIAALAQRRLSQAFRESQAWWDAHPDEFRFRPALLDFHYYNDNTVSREKALQVKETVLSCVRAFTGSPLADQIRRVGRSNWLPIDRNAAAKLRDGTVVLVKPDFAFRDGEELHIIDWKTGRADPLWEQVQITCYALHAQEHWKVSLPLVVPRVIHLFPEFHEQETEFSPRSVREVLAIIRDSQIDMQAACTGTLAPERFPTTTEPKRCRWCAFRGICDGASRCVDG